MSMGCALVHVQQCQCMPPLPTPQKPANNSKYSLEDILVLQKTLLGIFDFLHTSEKVGWWSANFSI